MPKVTIKTPDSTVEVDATTLKDISRVCRGKRNSVQAQLQIRKAYLRILQFEVTRLGGSITGPWINDYKPDPTGLETMHYFRNLQTN